MTITLELPAEIEAGLQAEAARQGVEPQQVVLEALTKQLHRTTSQVPHLPKEEANLLKQINSGLSSEWWALYERLKEKRVAETLSEQEHAQLLQMSDQLEQANARRIGVLVKLAQRRGTTVDRLMQAFGLTPAAHG